MPALTLHRLCASNGVTCYASPQLQAIGVPHAFSTRLGGVSKPPFDTLNLGNPSGCDIQDDRGQIEENYRRLQAAIGCEKLPRCRLHQVHGGEVVKVAPGREHDHNTQADALISSDPRRLLAVRIADCVPILLASADGRTVAAIHAGWRGIVAGVIHNTIEAMRDAAPPEQLIAAIGPCIGREAFEVGCEVVSEFRRVLGADAPVHQRPEQKPRINLREAARRQLLRAGVPMHRIDISDRCTHRDRDEFFSHRRDHGVTGRHAALIAPRT